MQVFFDFEKLENRSVAVAVSGGSDSMALLHYLIKISGPYNITVKVINVEHGIRGDDSKRDSDFVKNYCKANNLQLFEYSVDSLTYSKEHKMSVEESARKLRYDCFIDALNEKKCDYIATAHHLKDNAETVLFNIFRGCGISGLCGIKENRDRIIRPLIKTEKSQIDEYIKENNVPYVEDKTNDDTKYSRNFIRHNIIREIEKIFPDFENSIGRLSEIAEDVNDFLTTEAKKYITFEENTARISLTVPDALLSYAIIISLKELGIKKDWRNKYVEDCKKLINNQNGRNINLLNNITAIKEYGFLTLSKSKKCIPLIRNFCVGSFEFDGHIYSVTEADVKKTELKNGLYLDKDKIPETAKIRTKMAGDTFKKFGGKRKKLVDFLTDIKVPLRVRDSIPIIADNDNVLAIFGIAVSDFTKVDDNTKTIIKITKE